MQDLIRAPKTTETHQRRVAGVASAWKGSHPRPLISSVRRMHGEGLNLLSIVIVHMTAIGVGEMITRWMHETKTRIIHRILPGGTGLTGMNKRIPLHIPIPLGMALPPAHMPTELPRLTHGVRKKMGDNDSGANADTTMALKNAGGATGTGKAGRGTSGEKKRNHHHGFRATRGGIHADGGKRLTTNLVRKHR